MRLFLYPSLDKYSLKWLYYILPDYFKSYNNRLNWIEYVVLDFTSGKANPSGIFI